jgi:hypothetical protein
MPNVISGVPIDFKQKAFEEAECQKMQGWRRGQYQLGLVLEATGDHAAAADAFAKATQINPQMAYADYYGGAFTKSGGSTRCRCTSKVS